ncbi:DUF2577 domain-containing protein [Symbiobacterium terraclitae]|uniref:DUF2577 domain-containing protein n=1 Tax=Symbiobacterium terraclitae TaxID=557451 RepID=UPI0035B52CC2
MANLLELIKRAAQDAVAASQPVQVHIGTVLSADPLQVQVDQRFILPAAALVVPESLVQHEADLSHSHPYPGGQTGAALTEPLVIRRGLAAGDQVLLLRVQGGERYVILDRVVSA